MERICILYEETASYCRKMIPKMHCLESCIQRHKFYKLGAVVTFFTKVDSCHFSSLTLEWGTEALILDLDCYYFILELVFNNRTKLEDLFYMRSLCWQIISPFCKNGSASTTPNNHRPLFPLNHFSGPHEAPLIPLRENEPIFKILNTVEPW